MQNFREESGNTCIECIAGPNLKVVKVFLHGGEILSVIRMYSIATSIRVSFDSILKENGKPSKTAVERLNGLLDELNHQSLLPNGVRIFWDRDHECYYLGRGEEKIAVGSRFATNVLLAPSDSKFIVEASNLEVNSMS